MLGLGPKAKIFGLGLAAYTVLGLVPCGLVNTTGKTMETISKVS